MKGCYATDTEIQDFFQNIEKHNIAGIQTLNKFSLESESFEKRTMRASFYHWESFRIMVLHRARKSLLGIQKS